MILSLSWISTAVLEVLQVALTQTAAKFAGRTCDEAVGAGSNSKIFVDVKITVN